jgi:hypothetical protein
MAYAASNSANHRAPTPHHTAHRAAPVKPRAKSRGRHGRSLLLLPILAFAAVMIAAVVYVSYILWPQWPHEPAVINAPSIPVIVGSVAFNIPPEAIRVPMQRRPGTQNRVDLAFQWPSLNPPGVEHTAAAKNDVTHQNAENGMMNRIFVTIATSSTVEPLQNLQAIYAHYIGNTSFDEHDGLIIQPFLNDTPYQGEDLIYPQKERETMSMRCSRPGLADTPGICLLERHVGDATVTFRFPRAWLSDWRLVETNIGKLLATLQAPAS